MIDRRQPTAHAQDAGKASGKSGYGEMVKLLEQASTGLHRREKGSGREGQTVKRPRPV